MTANPRLPVVFVSHGGGPWPWVDGMKDIFAGDRPGIRRVAAPAAGQAEGGAGDHRPLGGAGVLGLDRRRSRRWTTTTAASRSTPTSCSYRRPGAPALAARVARAGRRRRHAAAEDPQRGFDHGTFVPLWLMYPDADVPVVQLSMQTGSIPPSTCAWAGRWRRCATKAC